MLYLKVISKALQRSSTYRLEYFTGVLNAVLYLAILTSVWQSVSGNDLDEGRTRESLILYAVISTLIKVSFGRQDGLVSSKIKNGTIVFDLLKPIRFPLIVFADTIGVSIYHLLSRSFPLWILAYAVLDLSFTPTMVSVFSFLLVYGLAFLIFFLIGFMISSLSFYFTEVFSFFLLYFALITLFSGAVIPLDLFPAFLRSVSSWLPFAYLYYYPTQVLTSQPIGMEFGELIARYFLMIGILTVSSSAIYLSGLKRLELAGG
ncbi:ABC-2 family transporter protein [Leptospira sp. 201903070]|uniref:ABC-2 family transporter protein n=1 Tax=Leptospira ainlahdjerensis TaxID=2810033 RepID=A0ABS2UAL9_9LEPT|nr:ABC-2 family transporter protein [Leptospira ainlahdjerensis]MBM9575975.1 ABC-2 family transporter protein [Leptospira ainlahdjerensis]